MITVGKKWKSKQVDELLRAILVLESLPDARAFFRDLLTEPELLEFANRWEVAKLLSKNVPYSEIEKKTGMSSTTIARISQWLNSGMGGYKKQIAKSHTHTSARAG